MAKRNSRRRFIAEINVVPYIDVMLVLLVIFMITVPLLDQGVEVDLPRADAEPLPPSELEPLILSVNNDGTYYLNYADNPLQPVEADSIILRAAAVLRNHPRLPVLVRADRNVNYGTVVRAMLLLQQAGADRIGLATALPDG